MSPLPRLLEIVRCNDTLCVDVENPGWDNARGYLIDPTEQIMYFPVAKKYLPVDPREMRVLIWSKPRLIVRGNLQPATSETDGKIQLKLALDKGWDEATARYMIFDQRTNKPRKKRYKLTIEQICVVEDNV